MMSLICVALISGSKIPGVKLTAVMDIKVLNFHAHEKVIIQMWNVAVADFKVSNDVIC